MSPEPSNQPDEPSAPARQTIELQPLEYPCDHLPQASDRASSSSQSQRSWAAAITAILISAGIIAAAAVAVYQMTR